MTDIEIITAADRAAVPAGHASLEEITALLNAAAALERARRPIVLTSPEASPAQSPRAVPERVGQHSPVRAPGGASHPGINVDLTGHGARFELPEYTGPLPFVRDKRSLAPLAFLVSGWALAASALGTAITGGNPILIGATFTFLTTTAIALSKLPGNGVTQ